MKKTLILFLFSIIIYGCPDPFDHSDNCQNYRYTFSLPVSFVPEDSVIHIGDTVSITSQFSNRLKPQRSNEIFIFDSVDFKISCHFIKVDTLIEGHKRFDFLCNFEIIADSIYNFRKGNTTTAFDYYYDDERYFLQFKFIPKVKGIYIFEFTSRINLTNNIQGKIIYTEDSICHTNRWNPYFITNNGQSYKELLKYSPNDYYKEKSGYYFFPKRDGAHCFKVVD